MPSDYANTRHRSILRLPLSVLRARRKYDIRRMARLGVLVHRGRANNGYEKSRG